MRVMIDSNILDRLDEDTEAREELSNRRDILLLVTPAQEREVAAIPDPAKRGRLIAILSGACRRLAPRRVATAADPVDDLIVAAAAGCDLLVSDDLEVLNKALSSGLRAMDWKLFLRRVVWAPRPGSKQR